MRRRLLLIAVAALLVVAFAVPIAAQAGWISSWSGDSASAGFSKTYNHIYTQVWVDAMKGKYQSPPGNGQVFSSVYVYIYSRDADTNEVLLDGWGYKNLGPEEFSIAGGLKSAGLKTTVPMQNWLTGGTFDLAVAVDWTANGKAVRDKYVYHYIYPGMRYMSSGMNAWKAANARGTFATGDSVVFQGAADSASLASGKSRQTMIY